MHEMHVVKDLFSDLLALGKEKQARKITKVYITLGEWTEINEEILRFFFEEHGKNTILEGAELSVDASPKKREIRLVSFDCE
ncbi:MAG: hydrogenase maturation nickel metallochaperone HypA [Candidatus Aureabacteria bacterium]|nr:hydrogenase maturation nickel metallochaperone HypA [Candidatus Auribacterota bacterium]